MNNVVSLTGGVPQADAEREFIDHFAQRLRDYVEEYGCLPETSVFALFGEDKEGNFTWSTCHTSPAAKARVEACAVAAGLLLRSLKDD